METRANNDEAEDDDGDNVAGAEWHAAKLIIRVQRENALKYSVWQDSEGDKGEGY